MSCDVTSKEEKPRILRKWRYHFWKMLHYAFMFQGNEKKYTYHRLLTAGYYQQLHPEEKEK